MCNCSLDSIVTHTRVQLGFNWSVTLCVLPRTELSEIPLGELQKLREKVGSKK